MSIFTTYTNLVAMETVMFGKFSKNVVHNMVYDLRMLSDKTKWEIYLCQKMCTKNPQE